MDEEELKLQNQKGFMKFERWVRRNVGDCPSGDTLEYYSLMIGIMDMPTKLTTPCRFKLPTFCRYSLTTPLLHS